MQAPPTWCFFLAGDTGDAIAAEVEADAAEIERAARELGREVWIVQARPGGGRELRPGSADWAERAVDAGDPESLVSFLREAVSPGRPAALVISGHGTGWEGRASSALVATPPATREPRPFPLSGFLSVRAGRRDRRARYDLIGIHMTPPGAQDTREIREALAAGLGGTKLRILGFDACLMATWEMLGHLADLAEVIVASPEQVPGYGWPYARLLGIDPAADAEACARAFVDGAMDARWGEGYFPRPPLVAVRCARLVELDAAVAGLATALTAALPTVRSVLLDATVTVRGYRATHEDHRVNMVDLGQLATHLRDQLGGGVATACSEVLAALDEVTIARRGFGGLEAGSAGISIYLPRPEDTLREEYAWMPRAAPWREFLVAWRRAARG